MATDRESVTREDVAGFFDAFVEAFATFDGAVIARRYRAPYVAMRADASTRVFDTEAAIAEYFQRIVDGYRGGEARACRYHDLEVTPVGGTGALGTVTWEILRADGGVLFAWRESYHLVRSGGRLGVFVSVDHAGSPESPAVPADPAPE